MAEAARPGAVILRPLLPSDAAALLEAWNQAARHDPLDSALLEEKIWGDPDQDPGLALAAQDGPALVGFITGVVRGTDSGSRGFVKLLAVMPPYQRQGLGSRLLHALEGRLAARGVRSIRVGESAPNYLTPGVDTRYEEACSFFAAQDYQPLSVACNMTARLAEVPPVAEADVARLAREGVSVRRAGPGDRAQLAELLAEFGGTWQAEVERSLQHAPPLVHLAWRQQRLLGFAACEGNNVGSGWFGPMGTTVAARGLGIGRVLLARCLEDLARLDFDQVTIPWVAPVDFYARHAAARVSRQFQRFEKVLAP